MTSLTLRQKSPFINFTTLTGGPVIFSLAQGEREIAALSYNRLGSEALACFQSTTFRFHTVPTGTVSDKVVVFQNDVEIGQVLEQHAWEYAGPKVFELKDGTTYVWKSNFWLTRCTWYSPVGATVVSVSPRGRHVFVSDDTPIHVRTILLILLGKYLALDSVPRNPMTWS